MKKKLLALGLAVAMVVSMTACGGSDSPATVTATPTPGTAVAPVTATPTPAPTATPAPVPTSSPYEVGSINFEDGLSDFALVSDFANKSDSSLLSVKDYNGSKVLYVENQGQGRMFVGIDIQAMLGDKIEDVRYITLDIGTVKRADKFKASEGELLAYGGSSATKQSLGNWSVYLEKKNPITEKVFEVPEGTFVKDSGNYIMITKVNSQGDDDIADLVIDNLGFLDKDGKNIKADTTVAMTAPKKFFKEKEELAAAAVKVEGNAAYTGDWTLGGEVPADVLAAFNGPTKITLKYELTGDKDYYIVAPMDNWWAERFATTPGALMNKDFVGTDDAPTFRIQDDGTIAIENKELGQLSYTLSPAQIAKMKADGKGIGAMVYGVVIYEIVVEEDPAYGVVKVEGDSAYTGDWTLGGTVPSAMLADFTDDVTVTLKFELTGDKDYYIACPIDSWWSDKFGANGEITDLEVKGEGDAENPTYHLQADGGIVIDSRELGELSYTLSAAAVQQMVADGKDLAAMVYGVIIYQVVLTGKASPKLTEKVEGDSAYTGDWTLGGTVPNAVLAKYDGDIDVTLKFELTGDKDYYIACPIDSWWSDKFGANGEILGLEVKGEGDAENPTFHLQADGGLVIDNRELGELTYTLSAAAVQQMVADGKDLAAMVYGVTIYQVVVNGTPKQKTTVKVAGDDKYTGDWTLGGTVPSAELAKFAGDIKVTLKYELTGDKDYYIACPIDSWWADKFGATGKILGMEVKGEADAENPTYHLQADGGIVIDNKELGELSYVLSSEAVQQMVTDGKDLAAMVYGVTIYQVVVEDN